MRPVEQTGVMDASALSRRTVLVGAAGAVAGGLAGCGSGSSPGPAPTASAATGSAPSSTPSTPSTPSSSASAAALPRSTPWQPSANDVDPQVKLRAVRLVEALGDWPDGGRSAAEARSRVSALGLDPALVAQAGPLLAGGAGEPAALQVLEAQYGGILTDSASVMVVCRQWTRTAAGVLTPGGTTVDVRLSRAVPRWTVTALHPAAPGPPAATLSGAASAVLASPQVVLAPAAEADLRSGLIHDTALAALLTLARSYRIELSVVRSGHPLDVFGTSRPSDHPQGRAFDVWRVDGHPVVDPATPRPLVEGFMRAAAAAGSYNVGGPWQLSGGSGNQFFSDDTHHDHVHVGFAH